MLTIDPARRLADALGIEGLGNEPIELESRLGDSPGIRGEGRLFALMLDMKGTFDDLVARFARDPAVRERILSNRIYQHVSDALAGSAEYAAMEKVFELHEREEFDLIVVDTPPSQHALDFLDAPQRMIDFLESRIVQLLLHPALAASRFGYRIFHRTAQRVLQLMERVSGVSFLQDISEFLLSFEEMSAITGLPTGTLKAQASRGRRRLRDLLEKEYGLNVNSCTDDSQVLLQSEELWRET